MYPDAYEVEPVPYEGVQILYEVLNERDGVLAGARLTLSLAGPGKPLIPDASGAAVLRGGRAPTGDPVAFDLLDV